MHSSVQLLTLVAAASSAAATFQGFNYDAKVGGRGKTQEEFAHEFDVAAKLKGTNGGFTSARLFTTVQVGTTDQPIAAIPAALKSSTSLLLGLWCSAGKNVFDDEINALKNAAKQYCDQGLDKLVAGISVGSEDLYRNSDMGKKNGADSGLDATTLIGYIHEVRDAIKNTCLEKAPIGHVDTWNAYIDPANMPVIQAIDWVGADEYPYFEYQKPNPIEKGKALFEAAIEKIKDVSGNKEIWVTESGWPVSGKKSGDAVASKKNAETYYHEVACPLFSKMNVWWYTLHDGATSDSPNPVFGLADLGSSEPRYDLSCDKAHESSSTKSSEHSKAAASSSGSGSDSEKDSSLSGSDSSSDIGSDSGSKSGSASGSGSGSAAGKVTTPFADSVNATNVNGPRPSGGLMPGSGNQAGGAVKPSEIPRAGSSQLNSLGAAAVALVLAVAVL